MSEHPRAWPGEQLLVSRLSRALQPLGSRRQRARLARLRRTRGDESVALLILASYWGILGTPLWIVASLLFAFRGPLAVLSVPFFVLGIGALVCSALRTLQSRAAARAPATGDGRVSPSPR